MSFSEDLPHPAPDRATSPPAPRLSLRSQITQRGPLTFVELQSRWDTNRIDRDAFVWCDGMRDFLQIRDVPALHEALLPPLPVPPRQHPVHPPRDPAPVGSPPAACSPRKSGSARARTARSSARCPRRRSARGSTTTRSTRARRVDRRHARLCTPPRRPRTLPRHLRRRRSRRFHRANHPPVDDGGHGGGGGGER